MSSSGNIPYWFLLANKQCASGRLQDAVGQGTARVATREGLGFSLFTFPTVTVPPDLVKLLRNIFKDSEEFPNGRCTYFSRIQMVVDDRCLMSVELQQCTWAIFLISPCLSNVMNHKTCGDKASKSDSLRQTGWGIFLNLWGSLSCWPMQRWRQRITGCGHADFVHVYS